MMCSPLASTPDRFVVYLGPGTTRDDLETAVEQVETPLPAGADPVEEPAESPVVDDRFEHLIGFSVDGVGQRKFDEMEGAGWTVRPDRTVCLTASTDAQVTVPAETDGLDRIDQRSETLDGDYTYFGTGSGVGVYVIDSGIRATHTDFGERIANGFSSLAGFPNPHDDCNGHGTHIAGTIGGTTSGVAKGVTLIPVRVFECSLGTPLSEVVEGIDWVIGNHSTGSPAVVNLSMVLPGDELHVPAQALIDDGITVVAAAGNHNIDACGSYPGGFSPAGLSTAITVGWIHTSPDVRAVVAPASGSNFGPCLDLFAPGTDIGSAWPFSDGCAPGTPPGPPRPASNAAACDLSGTSMAAAHVSGAAAMYLGVEQSATPAEVQQGLIDIATTGTIANAAPSPNRVLFIPSFSDLSITKTASPDPVRAVGDVTYLLTVRNNGPHPATGVVVQDNLPAGIVAQSATGTSGPPVTCDPMPAAGGIVRCVVDPPGLASGESVQITIVATAPATTGPSQNNVSVEANNRFDTPGNNEASATITVVPANPPAETRPAPPITRTDDPPAGPGGRPVRR